jgi:uncharacterized protein YbaA (DUF1428 family)
MKSMPEIDADIPMADKERLVDDILAAKFPVIRSAPRRDERAHQGQTARKILDILFVAHKNGKPLTQGQIHRKLERVDAEESVSDGPSNVRVAVGRLRKLLEEYFLDHSHPQQLRLEIPKGSYALRFFRGGLNVYDWFWAQYHDPESEPLFALLVPESTNHVQFPSSFRFMEGYWHFARLIRSKGRDLPVLPERWQNDEGLITKISRYTCSIVVGDDTCMGHFLGEERVEKIMHALAERYRYPFYLSRDSKSFPSSNWYAAQGQREKIAQTSPPLYKESVAFAKVYRIEKWNYGEPIGSSETVRAADNEEVVHVVLTRRSTSRSNATTLISSADPRATSAVAALVCSREGLKQIAAQTSFQAATTFADGTSKSFQIVFEVDRKALCTALDPVWKTVKVIELHAE